MYELTRRKLERVSSGRRPSSLRELVLLSNIFGATTPPIPKREEIIPLTSEERWFEGIFLEIAGEDEDYISVNVLEENYGRNGNQLDSGFLDSSEMDPIKAKNGQEEGDDHTSQSLLSGTTSYSSPINLSKFPNRISPFELPTPPLSYSPTSSSPPFYPPPLTPDSSPPSLQSKPLSPNHSNSLALLPSPFPLISYKSPPLRASTTRSLSLDSAVARGFYDISDWGTRGSTSSIDYDSINQRGRASDGERGEGEEIENQLALVLVSRDSFESFHGNRSRSLSPHKW